MKALILALCLFSASAFADDGILIIGDSTSLGPLPYIQEALPCVVHTPENSRDTNFILEHIPGWLFGKNYRIIYFNSGLWDIARRIPQPGRPYLLDPTDQAPMSVNPDTYKANLQAIVIMLRTWNPGAQLIFNTSTDVPQDSVGRIPIDMRHYNTFAKHVMETLGVEVDDRYAFMLPYAYLHNLGRANKVHYFPMGYSMMASHEIDVLQAHGGC